MVVRLRELVVEKNARLPDVCVKCGATAGLTRKKQRFQYTPPWAFALFGLVGLVAIPDPTLAMFGSLAPLLALALVLATTRRAEVDLALCARCQQRWRAAVVALVGTTLLPFLAFFPLLASIMRVLHDGGGSRPPHLVAAVGVLCLALLAPIVTQVAYAAPRLLAVKRIDARTVTLSRVHPTLLGVGDGDRLRESDVG